MIAENASHVPRRMHFKVGAARTKSLSPPRPLFTKCESSTKGNGECLFAAGPVGRLGGRHDISKPLGYQIQRFPSPSLHVVPFVFKALLSACTTGPIRRGFSRRGTKRKRSAVCLPWLLDVPRFLQPPIFLATKSSSDRNRSVHSENAN